MKHKLFVYGTLKQGYYNHRCLKGAKYLCDATLERSRIYNVGAYPALVRTHDDSDFVIGELYEIPDDLWPALDRLEGVPHLYTRQDARVQLDERLYEDCQVYVWAGSTDNLQLINSGNWE